MLKFRSSSSPFEDLISRATDEKNVSEDWSLILDICDKTVNYEEGPKLCLQAITKRLYHNVPRVVMQALILLDACVKNCGKRFLLEVSSRNFIGEITKLLSKMNVNTACKFKQLLKRWAEYDFKNDAELGLIPSLYYKLKSEGVEFPPDVEDEPRRGKMFCDDPDAVSSQEEEEAIIKALELSLKEASAARTLSKESFEKKNIGMDIHKSEAIEVRALYDFEAVEDNELTVKAGERVLVIDRSNSNWWRGLNHRGEGYFPSNFVTDKFDADSGVAVSGHQDVETIPKQIDEPEAEETLKIDEEKIRKALDLLHGTDPMSEEADSEEMLSLEKDCAVMVPLIEDELRNIDKKFTVLNAVNDQLMEALEMFYHLDSATDVPCYRSSHFDQSNSLSGRSVDVHRQPIDMSNKRVDSAPSFIRSNYVPSIRQVMVRPQVSDTSFGHIIRGKPLYLYYPTAGVLSPQFIRPVHLQMHSCGTVYSPNEQPQQSTSGCNSTAMLTHETTDILSPPVVMDGANHSKVNSSVSLPFVHMNSLPPEIASSGNVSVSETVQTPNIHDSAEACTKSLLCQLDCKSHSQSQQCCHQE